MEAVPDVQSVAESGVAGYEALIWYGFVAPARTPRPTAGQRRDRELSRRVHESGPQ
jgi:tripartite-type tricarboxylate transporter receptor subunit TctC